MRMRARRLELTSEQRARLDLKLIDLEAIGIIHAIRDPSEVAAGVRRLLAMVEKKRIPTNDQIFGVVLSVILRDGDDRKDIKTFEAGLQIARDRLGSNRSYKPILDSIAKRLEELKAEVAKPTDCQDWRETQEKPMSGSAEARIASQRSLETRGRRNGEQGDEKPPVVARAIPRRT